MTNHQYDFAYRTLAGDAARADLLDLVTIADGPVDLGSGWSGDQVNYLPSAKIFIEFQSAEERVPGFPPTRSCEVTRDHVIQAYGITETSLASIVSAAHGPNNSFKPNPLRGSA